MQKSQVVKWDKEGDSVLRRFLDWLLLGHDWAAAVVTKKDSISTVAYTSMSQSHQRAVFGFVQLLFICRRCGNTRHEELLGEKVDLSTYIAERMS